MPCAKASSTPRVLLYLLAILAVIAIFLGLSLMALSFHASAPGWNSQVSQLERAAAAADMIWGGI